MSTKATWSKEQLAAINTFSNTGNRGGKIDPAGMVILLTQSEFKGHKNEAQLRGKLVSMGIYDKPEEKKKVGGASSERKISFVRALEVLLGTGTEDLASFEKASKPQLEIAVNKLKEQGELFNPQDDAVTQKTKAAMIADLEKRAGVQKGEFSSFNRVPLPTLKMMYTAKVDAPTEDELEASEAEIASLANEFEADL